MLNNCKIKAGDVRQLKGEGEDGLQARHIQLPSLQTFESTNSMLLTALRRPEV